MRTVELDLSMGYVTAWIADQSVPDCGVCTMFPSPDKAMVEKALVAAREGWGRSISEILAEKEDGK